MYAFNWALTAFRSESYIGSATALPDSRKLSREKTFTNFAILGLFVKVISAKFRIIIICGRGCIMCQILTCVIGQSRLE